MLIILGGLPGTGKTTIACLLAQRLKAVHIRIDTIEQALRSSGLFGDGMPTKIGPAGYIVAYGMADDNLRVGGIVVADSVNPLRVTREAWRSVAARHAVAVAEIEVVCSDATEHRRRVETRVSDIPGLRLPNWQDVLDRAYEDWGERPIRVDTAIRGGWRRP